MNIGEKIKYHRKLKGYTQDDLSKICGISRPHIANMENGKFRASLDTLRSIASALGVPPSALLDDDASLLELVAADNGFEAAHTLLEGSRKYRAEAEKTLSDAKKHLIESVYDMTDDQVLMLQALVDEILRKTE